MSTYTFPISLIVDKQFNPSRLMGEIKAAIPTLTTVFIKADQDDRANLIITVNRALTAPEQDTVRATLTAHESDLRHLPTVKARKFASIDRKTTVIIGRGFVYNGVTHSLSENSQKNLLGIFNVRADPSVYPIKFNSKDDATDSTISNEAEFLTMYGNAMATLRAAWDSGTALKEQVRAASTVAAVNSVIDAR